MSDGRKDMSGFRNKNKIDRGNIKKKKASLFHSSWNIKTKTIKEYICLANHKQIKQ